MSQNEEAALAVFTEIERYRSGNLSLEELEHNVWRHLETVDNTFPPILAGRLENLAQEIRYLQSENLASAHGRVVDENFGADQIFNEITGSLGRYLD